MKWESGRQDATSSLKKMKIWSKFNTDCYLIKLSEGSEIEEHLDPVEGKKHYRVNITLSGLWVFVKDGIADFQAIGNFHLFRPDIVKHSAWVIKDTMILSLGIAV